jgi:hypothetical protein
MNDAYRSQQDASIYWRNRVGAVGPSDAQLLGTIAIYKHQQRSKRLANDLAAAFFPKDASKPETEKAPSVKVFFVARDGSCDGGPAQPSTGKYKRYYHPSYTAQFDFPTRESDGGSVYAWIKSACNAPDYALNSGTKPEWECFVREVQGEKAWRRWWDENLTADKAFDLLISAFSHLEYAGATPSAVDFRVPDVVEFQKGAFYPIYHIPQSNLKPTWIKLESVNAYQGSESFTKCRLLPSETPIDPEDKLKIPAGDTSFLNLTEDANRKIKALFDGFLDPFFSGQKTPRTSEDGTSFTGVALPLFDRWESTGPVGAFLGWIFMPFDTPELRKQFFNFFQDGSSLPLYREILRANLNDYSDSLAEHVLDEELKNYDPSLDGNPLNYFRKQFHHIEGWIVEGDKGGGIEQHKYYRRELTLMENHSLSLSTLHIRLGDERDPIVILRPKWDTITPQCGEIETPFERDYYLRVVGWARSFWNGLNHIFEEHRHGLQVGQSVAFHDYSKDLNALDWQVRHYADEVMAVKKEITGLIASLQGTTLTQEISAALTAMNIQSQRLGSPDFDFLLRLRFLMAHLRAQTEGRLYEQPEWCVQFLQSGTRRDIYMVLRALVWLPVGWAQLKKQETQIARQELSSPLNWARLFAFEEENDAPIETRWHVGEVIRKLFLQWRITERDFDDYFPAPIVNTGSRWDDQLLWDSQRTADIDRSAWLPPIRLLPLFVFSMRAAFQHAYLRTIFRALTVEQLQALPRSMREEIRISTSLGTQPKGAGIHYRIHLDFPAPVIPKTAAPPSAPVILDDLPYGNWKQQMSAYQHIVHPWGWYCEEVPGPASPQQNDLSHFRITLESKA